MTVHFSPSEMAARKQRLLEALAQGRLDGALLFAQESDYWLTGYDTFGFCFFQCLYVGADGRVALLTRSADLRQAQRTSNIEDIRIWKDSGPAEPTRDLAAMPPRRPIRLPKGSVFSINTNSDSAATHARFITPKTNSNAINSAQQPRQ